MKKYIILGALVFVIVFSSHVLNAQSPAAPTPPTVVTTSVTAIGTNSATYNGNVTASGGATLSERGFQRGLNSSMSPPVTTINGGSATGVYSATDNTLTCGTTYYFRAYAKNSVNPTYSVGALLSFTTLPCPTPTATPTAPPIVVPTVTTVGTSFVTTTSAIFAGSIDATGGANAGRRGFRYGTTAFTEIVCTDTSPASYSTGSYSFNIPGTCGPASSLTLTCGTTYQYQAFATNSTGPGYGSTNTFTTLPCPTSTPAPTATVNPPTLTAPTVSAISTSGATLSSNISNTGGANATARGFNYGLTTAYGTTISSPAGSYGTGAFSLDASSLTCGTLYHFRAYATNSAGPNYSVDNTFNTSPCPTPTPTPSVAPAVAPSIDLPTVSGITASQATLNSNISNTGGANVTTRGFELGPTTSYTIFLPENGSFSTGTFSATPVGLSCATLYHYRAYATNSAGRTNSIDQTFTTGTCPITPPTVVATTFSNLGMTSVTMNGRITNTGGANITRRGFKYGLSSPPTTLMLCETGSWSAVPISFSLSVPGACGGVSAPALSCGTTYYVRTYATNGTQSIDGPVSVFGTTACPPPPVVANRVSTSNITIRSVTLSGETTSGTATERGFEYGTDAGVLSSIVKANGSFAPGSYSFNLANLTPGTTYYFRAYALNPGGKSYSATSTFATYASPTSLIGYAWSSNIGWVNLAPIVINQVTGNLEGYAWSPNIGWIKFDGLSNYPTTGAPGVPAKIDLDSGIVSGWIRACAGTVGGEDPVNNYGANCSSMNSRTDGWDGWIELAGVHHPSVVANGYDSSENLSSNFGIKKANAQTTSMSGLSMDFATGKLSGMAWGGPVIGWINFNAAITPVSFAVTCYGVSVASNKVKFTAVASGGNGNYEYSWNNGAYSTTLVNKEVTYATGPGVPVTIPLSVREVGGTSVITPVPGCSYTPPEQISGSCVVTPVSVTAGQSVTFTVPADPTPAGSYTYEWIVDSGPAISSGASKSYVHTYNTAGTYNVGVRMYRNGVENRFFGCSPLSVTVADPAIKLFIGRDGESDSALIGRKQQSLKIKKGEQFKLVWENTLSTLAQDPVDGYTCVKSVSSGISNWGNWTGNTDRSGSVSGLQSSETGKYNFILSCESAGLDPKEASTTIQIYTTTGNEI